MNQDFAIKDNDLLCQNGDIAIANSDVQHIEDTINAFPGWWKNNPADGVGIFQYVNSSGQEQTIKRSVMLNLQSDGYTVNNPEVNVSGSIITINPNASI
jgi:hypothetical protein